MNLKTIFKNIKDKCTHLFDYGKNNKIVFIENNEPKKRFFMPKGLFVMFEGDNNEIVIEEPINFENTKIYMEGSNGKFSIKSSDYQVRDAKFYVDSNCKIEIGRGSQLKNRNLVMFANNYYDKPIEIKIKDNVYIATNVIIRTSDGHTILDSTTREPLNPAESITIEDNVWITSNCTILKGSYIPKGCIVGACSLVNKKFSEENCLIAGTPAKIIKRNTTWCSNEYGTYKKLYSEVEKDEFIENFNNIINDLKNKKVLLYGAGILFSLLNEKYQLCDKLNVVAISDKKFCKNSDKFVNIKSISPDEISNFDFDKILILIKCSNTIKKFLIDELKIPDEKIVALM